MKNSFNNFKLIAVALAALVTFASCNMSGTQPNNINKAEKVAVRMRVQAASSQPSAVTPLTQGVTALANKTGSSSVLDITQVKMLVEELELESALDQDSLDFEVNDLVVNLPLDGSEFTLTSQAVPEGVYDEFEMELDAPDNGHSVNDPDFYNDSGGEDYSMVIKGTYNGKDFVFHSEKEFELELELEPSLQVSGNTTPSVAINVAPFSWFEDSAGNILDPTDPANYAQINSNIAKSFGANLDDDNGVDNDNENDGDNDNG